MDTKDPKNPHGYPPCPARKSPKQGGGPCARSAGWGTDHPGSGPCKSHGGKTPIKHGRYSKIERPRIKELIDQFSNDPDPYNLLPEVVLLRALIVDFVERYDKYAEALIAWHESFIGEDAPFTPKPVQIVDILSAAKFIGQIGQLVERIEKQKQEGVISLEAVNRYVEQLGVELVAAAQEAIADADTRTAFFAAIDRRWETVAIDTKPRRPGAPQGA